MSSDVLGIVICFALAIVFIPILIGVILASLFGLTGIEYYGMVIGTLICVWVVLGLIWWS